MDERKLIFTNLLNGVPVQTVCEHFKKSEPEVMQIFQYILRRCKAYCFARARGYTHTMPGGIKVLKVTQMIVAHTLDDAKRQRMVCFEALKHINLEAVAKYKDIQYEMVTPDNVQQVQRNLNT